MSARARLDDADRILAEALAVQSSDPDADPDEVRLNRFEGLLYALVAMTGAHAAAVIEANEHRQLAFRVEHPGVAEGHMRHAGSATRPDSGA
jgi:hypothetical protein